MSRFHSYINTAAKILENFKGDKPFAAYLKQFFSVNKKYGAKDRRQITMLCYNFFRVGVAMNHLPMDQRMLMALFLCNQQSLDILEALQPERNREINCSLEEKLAMLPQFRLEEIFLLPELLSNNISYADFGKSFLIQPDVFIRIRPQTRISALRKLERSKLPHRMLTPSCVQLGITDKLEEYFIIDKEIVVQDYNSQKVLDYLTTGVLPAHLLDTKSKVNLSVWDCCAASGGKSILLYDLLQKKFDLTVSDIRPKIILNLHRRFKKAGIKEYKYYIADISTPGFKPGTPPFDLVICDAPCTGSGTWSRTPEQLQYHSQDSTSHYVNLQRKIITSAMPHVKQDGLFVYITCSVFKRENEDNASWIGEQFNCDLLHQELLNGCTAKADSMFVSVFRKS